MLVLREVGVLVAPARTLSCAGTGCGGWAAVWTLPPAARRLPNIPDSAPIPPLSAA